MKRTLCCLLTILAFAASLSMLVIAAGTENTGEKTVSGGDVGEYGAVVFKAFNVTEGMASIGDGRHEMSAGTLEVGMVPLTEVGTLSAKAPEAPEMKGWTFAGWYTAPVRYAFWGDDTDTGYSTTAPLPFEYDCNGNPYDFQEKDPAATHTLTGYWRWLSTLGEEGRKVNPDEEPMNGITVLYALYQPETINYVLDYKGWGGRKGAMSCGRQYGTPFGQENLGEDAWEGFVFDGWYAEGGGERMEFYSIPQADVRYVAHWHSEDGRVNWENYQEKGYVPVTSVVMKDDSNNAKDIGDILQLHAGSGIGQTIYAKVNPSDSGVTKLEWETTDAEVASVEVLDDGLRAIVRAGSKEGTAIVTVRSAEGCYDSVIVDTQGHAWDESAVVQWGNCAKPTKIRYTCVYCGKTEIRESYKNHQYAYREVAATCTQPLIWEHFCKVCGYVDEAGNMTKGPAKGHKLLTTVVVGCGGTVTTSTCTECGWTQVSNDNVGVHNWSSVATVDVRPTCHSEGSQSIKCLDCGISQEGSSQMIPADASLHEWGDWVVDVEATETVEGQKTRTCSVCGQEESRIIPPTKLEFDASGITSDVKTSTSEEVADQQAEETLKNTVDSLLKNENSSMLADDILNAAIQEKEISTEVRVTPVAGPENSVEAGLFTDMIGDAAVMYMDIDIFVMADNKSIGRITETDRAMTFNVAIPSGGRIVRVLRAHEGKVEVIPSWVEGNTVYFTTDKFSTFAVSVSNDIALAEVEPVADQVYTGSAITPDVKVTVNGNETLAAGKDYTLSYKNNVEVGTATIVVTGAGLFSGNSREVTFNIVEKEGEKAPETPVAPGESEDPGKEETPEAPVAPGESEDTGKEETPETPVAPGESKDPGKEETPEAPVVPGESEDTGKEETPETPVAEQGGVTQPAKAATSSTPWKSGVQVDWNKVLPALEGAKKGSNVDVKTGTEFKIPVEVQKQVAKDKVTLACQVDGTDITITLSSRDVAKVKKDIDLTVSNIANIPSAAERKVTDAALYSRVLNIGKKEFFSQKLNIHMVLGVQYAGKLAVMYSYDEITGTMRYEGSFRVTDNGLAMFPLERGDEYVIVVMDGNAVGLTDGYRVVAGDTLSRIAARNGISLAALLRANPQIKNANRIYVGEVIRIPVK